jgi:hypothetical protein
MRMYNMTPSMFNTTRINTPSFQPNLAVCPPCFGGGVNTIDGTPVPFSIEPADVAMPLVLVACRWIPRLRDNIAMPYNLMGVTLFSAPPRTFPSSPKNDVFRLLPAECGLGGARSSAIDGRTFNSIAASVDDGFVPSGLTDTGGWRW